MAVCAVVVIAGCGGPAPLGAVERGGSARALSVAVADPDPSDPPTITEIPVVVGDEVTAALDAGPALPAADELDAQVEVVPDVLAATPPTVSALADGTPMELDTLDAEDRAAGPTVESDTTFQTVAVTWPSDAQVAPELQARVRGQDGEWSRWFPLEDDGAAPDPGSPDALRETRAGTDAIHVGDASAVQVATVGPADESLSVDGVSLTLIGSQAPTAGLHASAQSAVHRPGGPSVVSDIASGPIVRQAAARPAFVTRAQWGAAAPTCALDSAPALRGAVVHHTAGGNSYSTQAQAMQQIRNDQAYHMGTRGWCDLGYNFVVDKWGTLYEGRAGSMDSAVVGVHASGFNTGFVGVSFLGNYDTVGLPAAALETAGRVIGWRLGAYGVNPNGTGTFTISVAGTKLPIGSQVSLPLVMGHKDVSSTACPGRYVYPSAGQAGTNLMPSIRAIAAANLGPALNPPPVGALDVVTQVAHGSVIVAGWAFDDDAATIPIHVYVDGAIAVGTTTGRERPDITAIFGKPGAGYSVTIPVSDGTREVCAYAINVPAGANALLGCKTVAVLSNLQPTGVLDAVTAAQGSISAVGWAFDEDTQESIPLHLYVDGKIAAGVTTGGARPDVEAATGRAGAGFSFDVAASIGTHNACVYAINVPAGLNVLLGCRTVTLANAQPFGFLDVVSASGGTITAAGWAIDHDAASIPVHVYVDGAIVGQVTTGAARPDVEAAFGRADAGYTMSFRAAPGARQVCVYAINVPTGLNTHLGCMSVRV
ncbi:N-acetylmuramoyl-L-alanine amidase [Xylanimonas ulmi]|uniref:N-acetylmuramoyl-L-alanine amidase n=1 Tax=Xylanimonas ulmi TaxID=228973 RepID=UPI0013EE4086|nr:N-acetylmuramoyl-L-alanine amidase [Xylanibacterium ulmi]